MILLIREGVRHTYSMWDAVTRALKKNNIAMSNYILLIIIYKF